MDSMSILSAVGSIFTLTMFAAPIGTCREIVRAGDTGERSILHPLATAVNCLLWMAYGMLISGGEFVVVTNALGGCVALSTITLFVIYSPRRAAVVKACGCALAVLAAAYAVLVSVPAQNVVGLLGNMACAAAVIMFAAPLAVLKHVLVTRSTELLSLPLSCAVLASTLCWLAFGVLRGDINMVIPNVLGLACSSVQILLITRMPKVAQKLDITSENVAGKVAEAIDAASLLTDLIQDDPATTDMEMVGAARCACENSLKTIESIRADIKLSSSLNADDIRVSLDNAEAVLRNALLLEAQAVAVLIDSVPLMDTVVSEPLDTASPVMETETAYIDETAPLVDEDVQPLPETTVLEAYGVITTAVEDAQYCHAVLVQ